jgi:hypothetical protein
MKHKFSRTYRFYDKYSGEFDVSPQLLKIFIVERIHSLILRLLSLNPFVSMYNTKKTWLLKKVNNCHVKICLLERLVQEQKFSGICN